MTNIVHFMHISLDGFVTDRDGAMNWITISDDIFDFIEERIKKSDTALYGRATYQMMEAYWPTAADKPNATKHDIQHARWYKKAVKAVLSRTMKEAGRPDMKIINGNLANEIKQLKQSTTEDIVIFGSPGAGHSLAAENLIDEYWLFVSPILLGGGTPLFGNSKDRTKLTLVSSHVFSCGVICLNYKVNRAA